MTPFGTPAIPKGSTILVTGANGWVASNVADQFLAHGYRVRGTVRDGAKSAWLKEVFDEKYGKHLFELVVVPDMGADDAYNEAIKGVTAVVHVASVMPSEADPNIVVPQVISGALTALKAAHSEPSVKRFVYTSSSAAAVVSIRGLPKVVVTKDTYTEDLVKLAWSNPLDDPRQPYYVYVASKAQAEQAVWKYYKEHKTERPDLIVNTVLPNMVFGKTLHLQKQGYPSTSGMIARLYKGEVGWDHQNLDPQYFVDSSDVGRLHVAGAIHPGVSEERIFGVAGQFSWDSILAVFRKFEPEKTFPDDFNGGEDLNEFQSRDRAEQILRDLGQPGWTSLEAVVLRNIEGVRAA
ncbi:hypothetical protein B0T10DRAFT_611953 [Thelonectria olida]|uniref:NAD-dependent epimerase/dehydratase domain-containing protein n=1 Tax=Thelonectria olida TaxID=1576542 RepID=A0A9P8VQG7_9HYPO|nr:hypothetical protein B0T10DRAFT_611953 [Thelonectria olida]